LTCKKTAQADETENTTHPAGRESDEERMESEETPFPERDLMDWIWAVAVL
jgi:hypothetical protein